MDKLKALFCMFACCILLQNEKVHANQWNNECNSCGFTVFGQFLYWEAIQDQIQYAAVLKGGVQGIIAAFSETPVELSTDLVFVEPKFQYKPGFRIGIDYALQCMCLDIELAWTRLHQKVNSRIVDPNNGVIPLALLAGSLFGFIGRDPDEFGFAHEATSRWNLQYDVIDLQIGSCYNFNCLSFYPFVGVKGAQIKQYQAISYIGFNLDEDLPINLLPTKKNNFYGVGPSIGFDSAWRFCSHWSLAGGVGAALLVGKFNVNETPRVEFEDNFISLRTDYTKKVRLRPALDAIIGLNWDTCFCSCYQLALGVAYEVQYWWNQWQAPTSVAGSLITGGNCPQGDLTFHGLTATAAISF